ncbi:MAG: hypothetical protein KAS99_05485 [Candidatus Omnitrophica bacterium]|nr:hypothetical protein [Candidatus Omnitrophota bacterium]
MLTALFGLTAFAAEKNSSAADSKDIHHAARFSSTQGWKTEYKYVRIRRMV